MSGRSPGVDLRWVWVAAEVLLVALSIAGVQALQRLYDDGSFFSPMVFAIVVAHAVLIATRWFGFNTLVSGAASLGATILTIVATHYSSSAVAVVIPTGATIDQARGDLEVARDVFNTLQTPVPALPGFVVIGTLLFWALAFAADWAAFRILAPGQALFPMLTVLIFVSILGVETDRVSTTAMMVVTGILFVLAHRAASRAVQGIWLMEGPVRGYTSLMTAGVLVAAIAALAGILGGPTVPGADEEAILEIGDTGSRENEPIEVISPLVQIQPRLVEQSDRILFTVETNERAYWRIAALDVFDGVLWRSQGQFHGADGGLDIAHETGEFPSRAVDATFDLGPLNVVWAPAAYLPVSVDTVNGDVELRYEPESATFIVDTSERRVSDGLRYRVESAIPAFTPELLRSLPETSTATVDPRYLDLPADYSPLARAEAERITAPFDSTYDKALALQNYFRENFTYDLDVAKGHDIRRIEDFLQVQRGYCEQFAGTFASMARAIGIPARVATGFTPGTPDAANPNLYFVSGKHAHAWPEVWIAGAGWVAFEPTPGRGAPNATEYTGAPESQAASNDPFQATEPPPEAAAAQPDESQPAPRPTPTPAPADTRPVDPTQVPVPVAPEPLIAEEPRDLTGVLLAVGLLALVGGWLFGVPAIKRAIARRRLDRVGDDTRRHITLAWSDTVAELEARGHPPLDSETVLEYAHRLEWDVPTIAKPFSALSELTVAAAYGSSVPSSAAAEQARSFAAQVREGLDADQGWLARQANEIDPRPLLRLSDRIGDRADRLAAGAVTIVRAPEESAPEPIDQLLD